MKRTSILVMALAAWLPQAAQAQQTTGIVQGTVRTTAGAPIAGADVIVEGTRIGTVTATDGRFVLTGVAPGSRTVRASLIGYAESTKPVRVSAGQVATVDFQLSVQAVQLSELVATGYRTQARGTVTGSVSTVSSSEFEDVPVDALSNALAGRLSGVAISQRAGAPGRESSIRIRAQGTFSDSRARPLFVIDGMVSDQFAFDGLSSREVESVTILKDAAAASVYGARAANGVVLVNTRRGKIGAPKFDYNVTMGMQDPLRIPESFTAYEHAKSINDGWRYNNIPLTDARYYTDDELEYFKAHSWNWVDELWHNPVETNQALNITGGTGGLRYFLSGSYLYGSGSFDNLDFKRLTTRGNLDVDITDDLTASVDFSTTRRNADGPNWGGGDGGVDSDAEVGWGHEDLYKALKLRSSMVPPYVNGLPVGNWVEWHPGSVIGNEAGYNKREWSDLNTKVRLEYRAPFVAGLSASLAYYRATRDTHRKQFSLPYDMALFNTLGGHNHIVGDERVGTRPRSSAEFLLEREDRDTDYQLNGQLTYKRSFGAHNFDALVVYEQAENDDIWFQGRRDNFISPVIDQFIGGSLVDAQANGGESQGARISYVGSFGYDYARRYFLSGSFRYDGSVIFAPEGRWGFFPSVSAGWRVSDEPFFKFDFINDLKLRASYGVVGRDAVGSFQWQQSYNIDDGAIFGEPTVGILPGVLANRNITWEKVKSYNLGLDSRVWNNRVSLKLDVFQEHNYDILGSRGAALPTTFGASLPDENYQKVDTHGFEVELGYDGNVGSTARAVTYYLRGNLGYATNKVVQLNEAENIRPYQSRIGRPILPSNATASGCFGLVATNILRTQADLDALPAGYTISGRAAKLGDLNYKDLRGPASDEPDGRITNDDRAWICDYLTPPVNYGVTVGGAWKALRIDAHFQGAAGHKQAMHVNGRDIQARAEESSYRYWADAWTPDNPNGKYPGWRNTSYRTRYPESSFWLRDAGFMRLKTVTVSYDLPQQFTTPLGVNGARLYFTGNNLLLLWDHIGDWGFDPEVANIRAYPNMRTLSLGVNVSLGKRVQ